jgi:hypothetical protein
MTRLPGVHADLSPDDFVLTAVRHVELNCLRDHDRFSLSRTFAW